MTESIQKQCIVSENKYIYSIFSKLAYPPKTVPETVALSPELQAHRLLWPNYNRFEGQNLQILNSLFNPASLFLHHQLQGNLGQHLSRKTLTIDNR